MKTQSLTTALALLVATFMWGCQEQASGPVGPEGLGPQFGARTCLEIPGCGKDKGGGDKGGDKNTVSVELAGGMVTSGPQLVQLTGKNNAKALTLGGTASYEMNMINTRDAGLANCVSEGAFDGDFKTPQQMLDLLVDEEQSRHISVSIDKEANGEVSLKQKINPAWKEPSSASGNTITGGGIAGNSNKEAFALLDGDRDIGPARPPKVTAELNFGGDSDVTKFTFLADFGIMWIRQLGFDGLLVCHNRDEVVVIVDLTPTL